MRACVRACVLAAELGVLLDYVSVLDLRRQPLRVILEPLRRRLAEDSLVAAAQLGQVVLARRRVGIGGARIAAERDGGVVDWVRHWCGGGGAV